MKKKVLWAILAAAGTGLAVYFIRKRRHQDSVEEPADRKPRRHLARAFSRAKEYANGEVG